MRKNSLKKGRREKEFAGIGDIEQIKSQPEPIVEKKKIIYDERQYSCKIPKRIMEEIGYNDGDMLKFKLIYPEDKLKKPKLEIEYIKI